MIENPTEAELETYVAELEATKQHTLLELGHLETIVRDAAFKTWDAHQIYLVRIQGETLARLVGILHERIAYAKAKKENE